MEVRTTPESVLHCPDEQFDFKIRGSWEEVRKVMEV